MVRFSCESFYNEKSIALNNFTETVRSDAGVEHNRFCLRGSHSTKVPRGTQERKHQNSEFLPLSKSTTLNALRSVCILDIASLACAKNRNFLPILDHHGGHQMRNSSFGSKEKSGWKIGGETTTARANGGAQETDPLIRRGSTTASSTNHRSSNNPDNPNLRERRPSRSSPITTSLINQRFGGPSGEDQSYQSTTMNTNSAGGSANSNNNDEPTSSYTQLKDDASRTGNASVGGNSVGSFQNSTGGSRSVHSLRRSHILSGGGENGGGGQGNSSPLLEIPEEIYRVRKAALQVLKPLTRTWVSVRPRAIYFFSFARTPFFCSIDTSANKFLPHLSCFPVCISCHFLNYTTLRNQFNDHRLGPLISLAYRFNWFCTDGITWNGKVD